MAPEKRRAIASKGGIVARDLGKAHRWNSEEARAAGRIGGAIVSQNRKYMAEIGRLGGKARGVRGGVNAKETSQAGSEETNSVESSG